MPTLSKTLFTLTILLLTSFATAAELPKPALASVAPAEAPEIHGPIAVGSTPGRPFLLLIPATGKAPLHFTVQNLPAGLTLDQNTGIITGSIKAPGVTVVDVKVRNAAGSDDRKLIIAAGKHMLALTPPMGWNSWNVWARLVTGQRVRDAAKAMIDTGLAAHGYRFVNIDDTWEGNRDKDGNITSNKKFPDMKNLGDSIHKLGLKFGIYSSPGRKTCAYFNASYQHEQQDADTWAGWGVDYVKYDWCSYERIFKERMKAWEKAHPGATDDQKNAQRIQEMQRPYKIMRTALDHADRDIVYSLCQYGMGDVWKWANLPGIRGNLWRTTDDIHDNWQSMSSIGFSQPRLHEYAGPGHWNDPDMLVVGILGWGHTHPSNLTPDERVTHISIWCMESAPLMIGCDMTRLDHFTRELLMNDQVLAVDQDPLGKQAWRVAQNGDTEVWKKPLWDGTTAVAMFNRGSKTARVTATWQDLGLSGTQSVRDLWRHKNLGKQSQSFTATVPSHGAVLIKIGTPMPTDKAIQNLVNQYQKMIADHSTDP